MLTCLLLVRFCSSSIAAEATPLLALSLLVLWTSIARGGANDIEDCCLSMTQHLIPGNIMQAFCYFLLKHDFRVPAVAFTTLRGHKLCATPPDQLCVDCIIQRLQKISAKSHSS
ncbi:C-C motif chemokine 19-like [Dugong dugon]